jgi:hypothetical protein
MIAEIAAPRLQIGSPQMARADYNRLDSILAIFSGILACRHNMPPTHLQLG